MKLCKCGKPATYLKRNRKYKCEACAIVAGMLVPCTGEAHRNPNIDNCMICMPRWGLMEVIIDVASDR